MQKSEIQTIQCPQCHHQFSIEDVIHNRTEAEIQQRVAAIKKAMDLEAASTRAAFQKQADELERQKREQDQLLANKVAERELELRKTLRSQMERENALTGPGGPHPED